MKRRRTIILTVLATVVLIAAFVGYLSWRRSRESFYSSSCANHFIQLRSGLEQVAMAHPDFVLPSTADTRSALRAIFTAGGQDWFGTNLLEGYGTACPESMYRDRSIGYVYIGDGLTLRDVANRNILILFCPGENHRGSEEHSHAWSRSGDICVLSNAGMISEIENALQRGRSGEVKYSERAMQALTTELAKRLRKP